MNARVNDLGPLRHRATDEFIALYVRLHRPVRRFFARYRLNADDVDDLTQDVFLRLAGLACLNHIRRPEAFVFTLARNLVRDRARRVQTRAAARAINLDEVDLPSDSPTPEQALEQEHRLNRAAFALEALKPATRQAFYLTRVYGHGYAEAAASMGVSVSMVEKHVMEAMSKLRTVETRPGRRERRQEAAE